MSVGDQSGSQSENWTVFVGNQFVGPAPPGPVLTSGIRCFTRGEEYEMYLSHNGSNLSSPDYDWHLKVEELGTQTLHLIDDPDNLVADHGEGPNDPDYAERIATLVLPLIEKIAVDSSDTDSHYLGEDMNEDFIATVKGTGNVSMKAAILPDTQFVKNNLVWSGGATADFADKSIATVSRDTSQKFDINLSVTGTDESRDLETWVIWATQTLFQDSGTEHPADMTDVPFIPEDFKYGIVSYLPRNGCAIEFTISPTSIKTLTDKFNDLKFDVKRSIERTTWILRESPIGQPYWDLSDNNIGQWGDDDGGSTPNNDEDLSPSINGRIYSVDFPGIISFVFAGELDQYYKANFNEWINVTFDGELSNGIRASSDFAWHSISRAIPVIGEFGVPVWGRHDDPFPDDEIIHNEIEEGHTTVGTASTPF